MQHRFNAALLGVVMTVLAGCGGGENGNLVSQPPVDNGGLPSIPPAVIPPAEGGDSGGSSGGGATSRDDLALLSFAAVVAYSKWVHHDETGGGR